MKIIISATALAALTERCSLRHAHSGRQCRQLLKWRVESGPVSDEMRMS